MNIIKRIQSAFLNQFGNNGIHRSDQLAVRRAYEDFARRHPDWAAAYFDEQFLVRHAALLLNRTPQVSRGSTALELAIEWSRQFWWNNQIKRRQLVTEATVIADDFLRTLEDELSGRSVVLAPALRGV